MMGSVPQSPTSLRPRSRDTGFPTPFCGTRNTTLPHPDADLSPNASISADDIAVNKVLSRQRRSFLAKNKRTISHGVITAEMEQMYSDMVLNDGESFSAVDSTSGHQSRPSKDGSDSIVSTDGSGAGDEGMHPTATRRSSSPRRRRDAFKRFLQH